MNIIDKYEQLRPQISDGDLILFHGTGIMARIIQNCDKAYYNHIGVVIEKHGALFIVDANANGVQADRLSYRINKYKNGGDFCILKPNVGLILKDKAMDKLLMRSNNKTIHYDFKNGFKELLNRKFGWNLTIKMRSEHFICSSNDAEYAIDLKMADFSGLRIAYPEDYIRCRNYDNSILIN